MYSDEYIAFDRFRQSDQRRYIQAKGVNETMESRDTLKDSIDEYLSIHFRSVTLTQLSDYCFYSYRQMNRYIRRIYGMSFPALVNRYKLESVRRSGYSGLSLKEAVAASGFASIQYYQRVMKNHPL